MNDKLQNFNSESVWVLSDLVKKGLQMNIDIDHICSLISYNLVSVILDEKLGLNKMKDNGM